MRNHAAARLNNAPQRADYHHVSAAERRLHGQALQEFAGLSLDGRTNSLFAAPEFAVFELTVILGKVLDSLR